MPYQYAPPATSSGSTASDTTDLGFEPASGSFAPGPVPPVTAPAGETTYASGPTASEQAYGDAFSPWSEGGGGKIEGEAPPPEIPSWYQHQSKSGDAGGELQGTIYFGTDDANLTPDDKKALDDLAQRWRKELESGDYELDLRGFADQRMDDEYNFDLGARRAGKVHEYLMGKVPGMSPEDATYTTEGERPSSNHPDDLARNRRVEVRIRRKDRGHFPLPPIGGPEPGGPAWSPPEDWSTRWEITIEGSAGAGLLFGIEGASMLIKNLDTMEEQRFLYTGGSFGVSALPVSASGKSGPFQFETSAPVPIEVFAANDNAHLQLQATTDPATAAIIRAVEDTAGIELGNALSGEVWVLTGPRKAGADVVILNTSGLGNSTPQLQAGASMGPTFGT